MSVISDVIKDQRKTEEGKKVISESGRKLIDKAKEEGLETPEEIAVYCYLNGGREEKREAEDKLKNQITGLLMAPALNMEKDVFYDEFKIINDAANSQKALYGLSEDEKADLTSYLIWRGVQAKGVYTVAVLLGLPSDWNFDRYEEFKRFIGILADRLGQDYDTE